MRILISGATGLVGTALTNELRSQGHTLGRLVRMRGTAPAGDVAWDPNLATVDLAAMEGVDAVVNLNGASIAGGRWTEARKALLRSSRIGATRVLVDALANLKRKPRVLISASATGYYGDCGDTVLTESVGHGMDFLGLLARTWESEAMRAELTGIRVVIVRFGLIFAATGGALQQMVRPIRLGVGGRLGSGKQWMPWVTLEDATRVIRAAIADETWRGPFNVVAPELVRNEEFTRVAARVLNRPAIFPVPALALRVLLGELAKALLASQRAKPEKLSAAGFEFRHPALEPALRELLGRPA
ncbi:MAG: TIGR01777 family oxidoreductase [Candidatus Acidiferrales bacterium]